MLKEIMSYSFRHLNEESVSGIIRLIEKIAPNESEVLFSALKARLGKEFSRSDLFSVVLPERAFDDKIRNERARLFSSIANKDARLLELGTEKAWPDDRVKNFLMHPPNLSGRFSELIRLDYDDTYAPDLVASCYAIPLRDGAVDYVGSNSLLEHVRDTANTLKECYRVLAPGGVMRHELPLFFLLHDAPKDYSRLAPDYFRDYCEEIGFEDIFVTVSGSSGRIYTALNFMNSFHLEINPERGALVEMIKVLLLLLSELDGDDRDRESVAHSIYVSAKKPGELAPRNVQRDVDGVPYFEPGSTTISRLADEIISPITKEPLRYTGTSFIGASEKYQVREGKTAYLRDIDSVAA